MQQIIDSFQNMNQARENSQAGEAELSSIKNQLQTSQDELEKKRSFVTPYSSLFLKAVDSPAQYALLQVVSEDFLEFQEDFLEQAEIVIANFELLEETYNHQTNLYTEELGAQILKGQTAANSELNSKIQNIEDEIKVNQSQQSNLEAEITHSKEMINLANDALLIAQTEQSSSLSREIDSTGCDGILDMHRAWETEYGIQVESIKSVLDSGFVDSTSNLKKRVGELLKIKLGFQKNINDYLTQKIQDYQGLLDDQKEEQGYDQKYLDSLNLPAEPATPAVQTVVQPTVQPVVQAPVTPSTPEKSNYDKNFPNALNAPVAQPLASDNAWAKKSGVDAVKGTPIATQEKLVIKKPSDYDVNFPNALNQPEAKPLASYNVWSQKGGSDLFKDQRMANKKHHHKHKEVTIQDDSKKQLRFRK